MYACLRKLFGSEHCLSEGRIMLSLRKPSRSSADGIPKGGIGGCRGNLFRRSHMTNPDIPKRLASKIHAAQSKLQDVCTSLSGSSFNYQQDKAELDEFEADPAGYASRRYPSHGVDSYPVQTRIGRIRETVTYNSGRFEVRKQRIVDAMEALQRVEQEVLDELAAMRPSSGRVPWPPPSRLQERSSERIERTWTI
jgi:hypothetical protein